MKGEIDENVDAVGPDYLGDFFIGDRRDVAPLVAASLNLARCVIGDGDAAVGEDFKLRVVVPGQEGEQIPADDVAA